MCGRGLLGSLHGNLQSQGKYPKLAMGGGHHLSRAAHATAPLLPSPAPDI